MKIRWFLIVTACIAGVAAGFLAGCTHVKPIDEHGLVGAWRGKVQFTDGSFAETKNLEFMYVFNVGGTMMESSNYDGSPPVPPAYGVWRNIGNREYEAKYAYFWTKAPKTFEEVAKGGGWTPGGFGLLTQRIKVSQEGRSFDSTIRYEVFDESGKPTEKESHATAQATRIAFQ